MKIGLVDHRQRNRKSIDSCLDPTNEKKNTKYFETKSVLTIRSIPFLSWLFSPLSQYVSLTMEDLVVQITSSSGHPFLPPLRSEHHRMTFILPALAQASITTLRNSIA